MRRDRSTHYEALGVSPQADQQEIRAAFRRKAKEHHPDICDQDDAEAFRRAQQAYETLRDPRSRRAYDAELRRRDRGFDVPDEGFGAPGGGGGFAGRSAGGYGSGPFQSPLDDLQAMFEEMFGGGFGGASGATRRRSGPDPDWMYSDEDTDPGRYTDPEEIVEFDVHMSPDEAFTGVTAHLQLDYGGTVVVDIPPGVRDGQILNAAFEDRRGPRQLRLHIRVL